MDLELKSPGELSTRSKELMVGMMSNLGSVCSLVDLHYSYRVGRSTASEIVRKVCKTIWNTLKDECLPLLTKEIANFPNCSGALDVKHIRIVKPALGDSLYFNYKHYHSVVLLGVAYSYYRFKYIDFGSFGKESNNAVFRRSTLWDRIITNIINIPQSKPLDVTTKPQMPFAFVGDEAFGLYKHVRRPYKGRFFPHTKSIFNYRLSRARRYIECTFGNLSNQWRISHRPLTVNIDLSTDILTACCVFTITYDLKMGTILKILDPLKVWKR
ncbi:hypothetical protein PR048_019918 [Dryococelus australis]|uniref:DDE Tnp4 domain-containing protein n=1 Tax=Dryococelus australis TaxID=614101 RepID=A0ABQ9H4Y7_9NEOP|nr:hypothetical protein PR048_019918 [Dryococelus australis]